MAANHMDASICFPNTLPGFCGQTFMERAKGGTRTELALLCVQAYNDWIIDEWCAGDGEGSLIPLTIVPLWDVQLCAEEIRRCAAKGSSPSPSARTPTPWACRLCIASPVGPLLRSLRRDRHRRVHAHRLVVEDAATSPDAPFIVCSTLTFQNAMGSVIDYMFSGTLARFPDACVRLLGGPGRLDALRA